MTRKTKRALKIGAGVVILAVVGGLFANSYFSAYETCLRDQMGAGQSALLAKKYCSEQQAAAEGGDATADASATATDEPAASPPDTAAAPASGAPAAGVPPRERVPSRQEGLLPGGTRPPPI